MVIRVFISGISGNKEVKKRQQRVLMILESKNISCEIIDITEPGKESDKEFMQQNSKPRGDQKHPLPPQIFNDEEYCGDYDDFDMANELSELENFLKIESHGSSSSILGKDGSDFTGFDLANENEVLLPFLKMAVPLESPPVEASQEESDHVSEKTETGSSEPDSEPVVTRPKPERPPNPLSIDENNDNGSNIEEESSEMESSLQTDRDDDERRHEKSSADQEMNAQETEVATEKEKEGDEEDTIAEVETAEDNEKGKDAEEENEKEMDIEASEE